MAYESDGPVGDEGRVERGAMTQTWHDRGDAAVGVVRRAVPLPQRRLLVGDHEDGHGDGEERQLDDEGEAAENEALTGDREADADVHRAAQVAAQARLLQAADLLGDPGRPPGSAFDDSAILLSTGRLSAGIADHIAEIAPALARVREALKPGASLLLGRFGAPPDPLAGAVTRLRVLRSGGSVTDADALAGLMREADLHDVHETHLRWQAPAFVVGRRPD